MALGVGGQTVVGVAVETTVGTYVAPTHYMLLRDETLKYMQDTVWRRPLKGIVDVDGPVGGFTHVEGDITVEVTEDILPQILRCARYDCAKTGPTTLIYEYVFTPNAVAIPTKTMSITVMRAGVVFGYTGCIVHGQEYTMDKGELIGKFSILGLDEGVQSAPTPSYVTTAPFGAGQYLLKIPSGGSEVCDSDELTFTVADAGTSQFRICSHRTAAFSKYGERTTTLKLTRDFDGRAEYDDFKSLTAKGITLLCDKDADHQILFDVKACTIETYDFTGGSAQADLVRAQISYNGIYDAGSTETHEITVRTEANIPIP
jgi:hypothetical protein